jgi:hypothetical protein
MKRALYWILLCMALMAMSAAVYLVHYLIFRDAHHIFLYLIGDVAFVFIEVLMVTLIIHQLLSMREKRAMLNKLNMVIGAFFSEAGSRLLEFCSAFDPRAEQTGKDLLMTADWTDREFAAVSRKMKGYGYKVDPRRGDLAGLRDFLVGKRRFFIRLLENPNLLEHETFTDLLWAVFHLAEELEKRTDIEGLPDKDKEHLAGDIERAYRQLVAEWLSYMEHLKGSYPYLFSLAVRTNPFNPEASVVLRG